MRRAIVFLERLCDPVLPLQQLPRPPTPPPEVDDQVDWDLLEQGLEAFDAPQQQLLPQPVLAPVPPPQVDWALIAYALAMVREMELHQQQQQHYHP